MKVGDIIPGARISDYFRQSPGSWGKCFEAVLHFTLAGYYFTVVVLRNKQRQLLYLEFGGGW